MKNKIYVWSHMDLDGVVSYLILKWYFKQSIPVTFTTANRFKEDFERWSKDNVTKYDKIFILDLDVADCAELVDLSNVSIYDHHTTHTAIYKHARAGVTKSTSAAKLLYSVFSKLPNASFTDEQKKLILFADDYDSYTLQFPESEHLNILLFESQNKPFNFIKDFETGFKEFTQIQKNIIILHKRKLKNILETLQIFHNDIKIQGKQRHVVGAFANECINEVADYLIHTYKADLAFVVNLKSNHVSLRKSNKASIDLDVSKVAQTLCDGGGRSDTAGGILTEKFQDFTKLLIPVQ